MKSAKSTQIEPQNGPFIWILRRLLVANSARHFVFISAEFTHVQNYLVITTRGFNITQNLKRFFNDLETQRMWVNTCRLRNNVVYFNHITYICMCVWMVWMVSVYYISSSSSRHLFIVIETCAKAKMKMKINVYSNWQID